MTGAGVTSTHAGRLKKAHHGLPFCRQARTVGFFVIAPRNGERGCRGYLSSHGEQRPHALFIAFNFARVKSLS
jgi:hypothetical protein